MVSEKPPRRSTTNKEPVTIDLTAEESAVVAEPVRANDTDETIQPAETETADDQTPDVSASPATSAPAALPETEAAKAETPPFDDPAPDFRSDTDSSGKVGDDTAKPAQEKASTPPPPFEPRQTQNAAPASPTPANSRPATSTLVAAGIFGGIVALLLAGSMQYAGLLPGATSSSSSSDSNVSAEIASLRQEIAALASRPAAPPTDLANRIAALESSSSAGSPNEAMTQRLAALESQLSGIKSATEATSGRLQQAEAQIADKGPEQMAARAVAAAALKSAIDRGGSFEAELETYKTLTPDDPATAQLQPLAAKGVLSRVELQGQASSVANAMIDAVSQPDPNLGIGQRLMASALSVVKVRKVGDVTGNTAEDIVARFEDRLRSGDLPGAAREWAALPEPAKAASQAFKQELDARIEVENLVSGTLTRAITGTQG